VCLPRTTKNYPNLKKLSINTNQINLEGIDQLKDLEYLSFYLKTDQIQCLQELNNLKQLKKLEIFFERDSDADDYDLHFNLGNFQGIEEVRILSEYAPVRLPFPNPFKLPKIHTLALSNVIVSNRIAAWESPQLKNLMLAHSHIEGLTNESFFTDKNEFSYTRYYQNGSHFWEITVESPHTFYIRMDWWKREIKNFNVYIREGDIDGKQGIFYDKNELYSEVNRYLKPTKSFENSKLAWEYFKEQYLEKEKEGYILCGR
jgi:hypothetical protein